MTPEEKKFIRKNLDELISNTSLTSGKLLIILLQTELIAEEKQAIESKLTEYQQCYELYRIMTIKTTGYLSLMRALRKTKHTQAYDILKSFFPVRKATSLRAGPNKDQTSTAKPTQNGSKKGNAMILEPNYTSKCQLVQEPQKTQIPDNYLHENISLNHFCSSNLPESKVNFDPNSKQMNSTTHVFSLKCPSQVYCFQYDKRKIISGHEDGKIRIWDIASLNCTVTLDGHGENCVCDLQYNDKFLVGACKEKLLLWNINTRKVINKFEDNSCIFVKLKLIKNSLVALEESGKIYSFKIQAFGEINVVAKAQAHDQTSTSMHADEQYVITGGWDDKTVKVWQFGTFELLRTLFGHDLPVRCVFYCNKVVVSGDERHIRLWKVDNGRCFKVLDVWGSLLWRLAFDDLRLVSGHNNGNISIWEIKDILNSKSSTFDCLTTLSINSEIVWAIGFDEQSMVVSSGNTIKCFKFLLK